MTSDQQSSPPVQDLPRENVEEADIAEEDILLGRGGKTNHHIGNARYLKIIEARQVKYMLIPSRTEKTEYAMKLVQTFRQEGSRFLKKDATTKLWNDVGDTKMREKVSQNLREHQPKLKKEMKEGAELSPVTSRGTVKPSSMNNGIHGVSPTPSYSPNNNMMNTGVMQQPMMFPSVSGSGPMVSPVPPMIGSNGMNNGSSMKNSNMSSQAQLSPHQMQMMSLQLQQQNAQMQAVLEHQKQQIQSQMRRNQMNNNSNNNGAFHSNNSGYNHLQQPSLALPTMGTTTSMATVTASNIRTMNHDSNNNNNNTMRNEPIPFHAGGVVIQPDNNDRLDPFPLDGNNNGDNINNSNHGWGSSPGNGLNALMGASLHSLTEESPSTPTEAEEAAFRNDRAFSKQQDFADRDAGYQSSSTLEDDDEFAADVGGPPPTPSRGAGVFFGSRRESYGDIDIAGAMGESTQSLLDSLRVDAVPEDAEYDDGEPVSPKPEFLENNNAEEAQFTPVTDNLNRAAGKVSLSAADSATITPPVLSPGQRNAGILANNVLDNDALDEWANAYDNHEDDIGINPFVANNGGIASPSQVAPFRRNNTYNGPASSGTKTAPFRRTYTNPTPGRVASPFETSTEGPSARRGPRKTQTCPARPQSPTGGELSPRPSALTMSKRGTSNVNETPETRGHLIFQERQLGECAEPDNSEADSIYSRSSSASIKKASLGRDTSARAHALKQQFMPQVYGSPCGNSASTLSTSTMSGSSKSSVNGWPAALPFTSSTTSGGAAGPAPTSPTAPKTGNSSSGLTREITPRTGKMMMDFGNLDLGNITKSNTTRTATTFRDTLDTGSSHETLVAADKYPMDLIVKKPARMMWRNRTSTIDALDLDSLEDDPVLQDGQDEAGR